MNIDKLFLANLVGEVMDKIVELVTAVSYHSTMSYCSEK